MRGAAIRTCLILLGLTVRPGAAPGQGKEFLTPLEIEKVQAAQEIDLRVKVYLQAAETRLKTTLDRLGGKESVPGEPLEFFSVEDMLDGYYRIIHSIMMNLEDAAAKPSTDPKKFQAGMKSLKASMENCLRQLEALKKVGGQQKRDDLYALLDKDLEISKGALEGAAAALARKLPR